MGTTVFHEALTADINHLIITKIQALKRSSDKVTKVYLDSIRSHRCAKIELENDTIRSPDEQYKLVGQKMPGVVLEVSFS